MDSEVELSIKRTENELIAAKALFILSDIAEAKTLLKVPASETFYSSVIAHAYYTIFYAARTYVVSKGIKLPEQGVHQAVYSAFRKFVRQGKLAEELLALYEDVKVKAETLLEIFDEEEENRTKFTYKTFAQANKAPAEKSIQNAEIFLTEIKGLIGKN